MQRFLNHMKRMKNIKYPEPLKQWKIVQVISGKEKGKQGKVVQVLRKKQQLIVEGVNIHTRHIKRDESLVGSKIEMESPISYSNVALLDPETHKPTKIKIEKIDGENVRISKISGKIVPKPPEVLRRSSPRPSKVGPLDTLPEDVLEVTYDKEKDFVNR